MGLIFNIFDSDFLPTLFFDKLAYATCILSKRFLMRIVLSITKIPPDQVVELLEQNTNKREEMYIFLTELLSTMMDLGPTNFINVEKRST